MNFDPSIPRGPSTSLPTPVLAPFKLWMIHLSDLTLNLLAANWNNSLYRSTHSKKFRNDSEIYARSGQIWPVMFAASSTRPAQHETVIICSFESCEVCTKSPVPYKGSSMPFVHLKRDMLRPVPAVLGVHDQFNPLNAATGIERTLQGIVLSREKKEIDVQRVAGEVQMVEVQGCDTSVCRVCSGRLSDVNPLVAADVWFKELEAKRSKEKAADAAEVPTVKIVASASPKRIGGGGGKKPPPPPPPGPGPSSGAGPSTIPSKANLAALGTENLRMCHRCHVDFEINPGTPTFKAAGTYKLYRKFEQFFIPEDSEEFIFGGPLHRVTFPVNAFPNRGRVRDVMLCTYKGCKCNRRKKTQPQISNGGPWCHRRLVRQPYGIFFPGRQFVYVEPAPGVTWERGMVDVDGFNDGRRKRVECFVCVEGTCGECDDGEEEEGGKGTGKGKGKAVEEDEDEDEEMEDGDGDEEGEEEEEEEEDDDDDDEEMEEDNDDDQDEEMEDDEQNEHEDETFEEYQYTEDRNLRGLTQEEDPERDQNRPRRVYSGKTIPRAKRSAGSDGGGRASKRPRRH